MCCVLAREPQALTGDDAGRYQLLRVNVDLLKLIQLGLTFFDEEGKTPLPHTTWQFNFK